MEENRPGYYAVIPADVRYDERIAPNAKLLYGEVSALIGKEGYCFASNQYFAGVFGFSLTSVTRLLTQLEQSGYIRRTVVKDKEGKVVQRKIYLSVSLPEIQPPTNFDGTPHQNCGEGTPKIGGDTNTSITNIEKENSKKKNPKPKAVPLTDKQLREDFAGWIVQIAPQSWPREMKLDLLNTLCRFYAPRSDPKRNPERTANGLTGLKRNLLKYSGGLPEDMILILDRAIESGWRGIRPLAEKQPKPVPHPVQEEDVRWL